MKHRILLCITIGVLLAAAAGGCGTSDSGHKAGTADNDATLNGGSDGQTDNGTTSDDGSGNPADGNNGASDNSSGSQADRDGSAPDGNFGDRANDGTSGGQADGNASDSDAAQTGAEAETGITFEATDMDGDTVSSDIFSDSRLTMVNVWATYCGPCLSEMPELGELAAEYDQTDFRLIGIVSDVTEDADQKNVDLAADLIEETGADYTHLLLNESLYYSLLTDVSAVPTTFFIDENGSIVETVIGARDKTSWKEIIDALLEQSDTPQ